jgi:hypothetical protein
VSEEVKDFLGRDIAVGATVVYPTRKGSNMWLSKGVVEAIVPPNGPFQSQLKVAARTDDGKKRIVYVPYQRTVVAA